MANAQSTQYNDFMSASELGMTGLDVLLFGESVTKDNPSAIYVLQESALTICHDCSPYWSNSISYRMYGDTRSPNLS